MQKTFTKSFAALLLVLALCLGLAQALLPANSNVAYGYASNVNPAYVNEYTGPYYDNLNEDKEGKAFRSELASLITTTHKTLTVYSGDSELALNNIWPQTDIDLTTGKMLWYYTGTQKDGFSGSSNREHVWPKDGGAAFSKSTGCGADAHHLRPTDSQLNSTRGSLSYGELSTSAKEAKEAGQPSGCYYDGSFFYPCEGYRGSTARILMYVQTRWGDQWNLKFVQGKGHCKTIGDIETLFKWHLQEPPSQEEIYRNNAVAAIQGNRNPFIDHPEYAAKIYCYDGESYNSALLNVLETVGDPYDNTNVEPLIGLSFAQNSLTLPIGQQTTLTAIKNPSNAKVRLNWTSGNTTVATVESGVVTAKAGGKTTITATDRETGISASIAITVKEISGITLSGVATKLQYTEGEKFDPTGISVTAIYDDGTFSGVPSDTCQWLDGVTGLAELSAGTTVVTCKLGNFTQNVTGITVNEYAGGDTVVITRNSFKDAGSYAFYDWTQDGIGGVAYIYTSNANLMQFNSSKTHHYLASSKPALGGIKSVTVKLGGNSKGTTWQLFTSNTPYGEVSNGNDPTTGEDHGTQDAKNGATWALDGTAKYFTLNYTGTGVCYVESITIEYGNGSTVDPDPDDPTPPTPVPTINLNKTSLSLAIGDTAKLSATTTGTGTLLWTSSNNGVATVSSDGTVNAIATGTAIVTASFGGKMATCTVIVTDGGSVIDPDPDDPTPPDPNDPTAQFIAAVQQVADSTTQPDIRNAIKNALAEYQKLTVVQKADSAVTAKYAELQQAIDDYNANVVVQNNEMQRAIKTALSAFYGTSVTVVAATLALYVLKRRFF